MNYYINYPTEENMELFHERCAQFEAGIIFEHIRSLDISQHGKKQVLEGVLNHLKANPR